MVDYMNSPKLKLMFKDLLPEMVANRLSITEEQNNINIDNCREATPDTKALWAKIRKTLSTQFDIVENKFCTCKTCGTITKIPINEIEYYMNDKFIGRDGRDAPIYRKELQVLSLDRLKCFCCLDGKQAADNADSIVRLLVSNQFTPSYEMAINSKKSNLSQSNIPVDRFRNTFNSWKMASEKTTIIKNQASIWLKRYLNRTNKSLLLSGVAETGKRHIAIAIAHKASVAGKIVRYIDFGDFVNNFFNKAWKEYIINCEHADLLIVANVTNASEIVLARLTGLIEKKVCVITVSEKYTALKSQMTDNQFEAIFLGKDVIKFSEVAK